MKIKKPKPKKHNKSNKTFFDGTFEELIDIVAPPIKRMVHVYFYALPIKTKFTHKGEVWQKTGEEEAIDSNLKEWRFESHYGCLIDKNEADILGISEKDYRPLN